MSRRQLRSDDVDGFVLAASDEFREICLTFDVDVDIRLKWLEDRGRFRLVATAYEKGKDTPEAAYACGECLWPTHSATSLHALLYSLAVRLAVACQRKYESLNGHWPSEAPAKPAE